MIADIVNNLIVTLKTGELNLGLTLSLSPYSTGLCSLIILAKLDYSLVTGLTLEPANK